MKKQQLSAEEIRKIKEIENPLIKKRYTVFFGLPESIQLKITSANTNKAIDKISTEHDLTGKQTSNLAHITGMVLLGETHITEFVENIQEKLQIDKEFARKIARDINSEVFLSVKDELKQIHQIEKWPREEEAVKGENEITAKEDEVSPSTETKKETKPKDREQEVEKKSSDEREKTPTQKETPTTGENASKTPDLTYNVPPINGNIVDLKNLDKEE